MTTPAFAPRLMQATAAAHYLGVSRTKFYTLGLPSRMLGGNRLYDRHDLDAFADRLDCDERGAARCDEIFGASR